MHEIHKARKTCKNLDKTYTIKQKNTQICKIHIYTIHTNAQSIYKHTQKYTNTQKTNTKHAQRYKTYTKYKT